MDKQPTKPVTPQKQDDLVDENAGPSRRANPITPASQKKTDVKTDKQPANKPRQSKD